MDSDTERRALLEKNIYPSSDVSLAKLEQWLTDIDNRSPQELHLKDVSFQKSFNRSLGLSGDPQDFTVFIPWGKWEQEGTNTSFPSVLQKNIIDVLSHDSSNASTPFVDFTSLVPTRKFLLESPNGGFEGSVADAIVKFVGRCNTTSTKPVIRFLIGSDGSRHKNDTWYERDKTLFTDIFWKKDDQGNYSPRVEHPNATIYVGYYNPDFQPKSDDKLDLVAVMKSMKDIVAKGIPYGAQMLKGFDPASSTYVKNLIEDGMRTISWNHGKIVAVNGSVMMTGGGNLWDDYKAVQYKSDDDPPSKDNYRIDHNIVDHQAVVVGDAAISAHHWADYFWNYLKSPAKTDNTSCWWNANLSKEPQWSSGNMPDEGRKSPFKYASQAEAGKIPVLTVAKLGDWYGPQNKFDYPTLIIDLARDILLNHFWQTNAELPDGDAGLGFQLWALNKGLSDDAMTQNGWLVKKLGLEGIFSRLSVNPTAWASRYTKTQAVAYASSSVIICQQSIVAYLQARDGDYTKKVTNAFNDELEKTKRLTPKTKWDGFIWPFDMMVAIAQAIGAISKSSIPDSEPFKGVYIVQTTKKAGDRKDWDDQTAVDRIRYRIRRIMMGLPETAGGIADTSKIDGILDKYLHFKRVMEDDGKFYSHSKIVCVDKRVMYVGSDNAYPCYNEEHGIWVEDRPAVDAWIKGFFNTYWHKKCTEVSHENEYYKRMIDAREKVLSTSQF